MRYKDLKVLAGAGQGFSNKMALLKEIRYHFSKKNTNYFHVTDSERNTGTKVRDRRAVGN